MAICFGHCLHYEHGCVVTNGALYVQATTTNDFCLPCLLASRPTENSKWTPFARLRAGIMAERCLAKAPTLARKANTTVTIGDAAIVASTPAAVLQEPSVVAVDFSWSPWGHGDEAASTVGDFEAAQAAAREAEDNYTLAGNPEGALRARRTELSLRGDEALVAVAPLFDKR